MAGEMNFAPTTWVGRSEDEALEVGGRDESHPRQP
jgi:hypothetical protein